MTDIYKAAQQALEALLEVDNCTYINDYGDDALDTAYEREKTEAAITALRTALAEPEPRNQCGETCERAKLCAVCAGGLAEQEPVAWWHRKSNTFTSGNLVSNFAEWTPLYTEPQPKREPVEATPYNLKRIAWELERTALGDGFYGAALWVAKDMPGVTPEDRSVLDRYATGRQTGTDHVHLQWLAQRLYNKDERKKGLRHDRPRIP